MQPIPKQCMVHAAYTQKVHVACSLNPKGSWCMPLHLNVAWCMQLLPKRCMVHAAYTQTMHGACSLYPNDAWCIQPLPKRCMGHADYVQEVHAACSLYQKGARCMHLYQVKGEFLNIPNKLYRFNL